MTNTIRISILGNTYDSTTGDHNGYTVRCQGGVKEISKQDLKHYEVVA